MALKIWKTPVVGNFSDATKWNPAAAPVNGDTIIMGDVNQVGTIIATEDLTLSIGALTMAGNHKANQSTTLTLTQPAVLTVNGPLSFDGDSFINGSGTLVANGAITGLGTIIASNGGTIDVAGTGSIASGVVLDFDVSTTLASTLKLDLSGGITQATNIRMNSTAQVLEIGPAAVLTINAAETFSNGTVRMSGGTITDTFGITVGKGAASGNIIGFGTLAADLLGGGQKGQTDTVTASGGTLVLTGGWTPGTAIFVAAVDTVAGSDIRFDGTAALAQPVVINNAAQTLEIGTAGNLTMTGLDLVTNGTVKMDGGSLTDTSGIFIDTGATLIGKGLVTAGTTLSGVGVVKASGGVLELGAALTSANTGFDVDTVAGSVLKIDGGVSAATTLSFLGASGALELADVATGAVQGFAGKVAGLNVGASATVATNEINIQAAATKAVLSGSTLTVLNGAATVATIALAAAPIAGAYAVVQADAGLGGSDIFLSNAPPPAPGPLTLAPASDSGTKGDNITNVVAPTITGTGLAGDAITLFDGATQVGTATVAADGTWLAAATLTQGANALTAKQSDPFGNASGASTTLNITLDTVAPVVTATLASDNGASPTDHITTKAALSGTADANASVTISNGGTVLGTTLTGPGGAWSFSPVGLVDGSYSLTASETDAAGNVGSSTLAFTLDTAAPAAPGTPDLLAASDSGASSTDNVTSVATPSFTGTAEANAAITLLDGATVVGTGAANAAGVWTVAASALTNGVHAISAKATDLAGNVSVASAALSVTIDTAAPAAPGTPDLLAASDSGASSIDNVTSAATPSFTGTAEAGAAITLLDGAVVVGTGAANAAGVWTVAASALADGVHAISAKATDLAGNVSVASAALSVTIDTAAPAAPGTPDLLAASDSGASSIDNVTSAATPSFTGTAEAGAAITLLDGAVVVGTGAANAAGVWTVAASALADGVHAISAKATDLAGNVSVASAALSVTIDTAAPAAPGTPDLLAASDSGASSIDNVTSVATPSFTGTAEANAAITLLDGATVVGTGAANAAGVWTVAASALTNGVHAISAKATDLAGNVSVASAALSVTVDTAAPAAPGTPDLLAASDSGASSIDNVTSAATPSFTGTAEAGAAITLLDGAVVVGTGAANAAGVWTVAASALADGVHAISAKATDLAGNVSVASAALSVTIDTAAPAAPGVTQVTAAGLSGTAEANAAVALFDGATPLGLAAVDATGAWSLPVALSAGTHSLTATATDLAGNASLASAAVGAVIGTAGDDALSAGPGVAFMLGGAGNDTYAVGNSADVVTEIAGEGTADTVVASVNYTLTAGSEIEFLTVGGAVGLALTGNEFANTITGGIGKDTLAGGAGDDTFVATVGDGNDSYSGGIGTDTYDLSQITANVTVSLAAGTASSLQTGNDTLTTFENVVGGAGNDTLTGDAANNILTGNAGNDTLNGGAGADTMVGGAGNDSYVVDNSLDVVTEAAGGGADNVTASVNYTLATGSEVETLRAAVGAPGLTLTGNEFNNTIVGGAGNDTLSGGAGNDTLDGGLGADTMRGGAGNDTYVVDNSLDVVTETAAGGTDRVQTSVDYTLAVGSEVEILQITTAAGHTISGNDFANTLSGGAGDDTLNGGGGNDTLSGNGGADTMAGGLGSDTYLVENAADVVIELAGQGIDTISTSVSYTLGAGSEVEFLRSSATTGLTLTGNELTNTIVGSAANDTLFGLAGNDGLNGGAGADTMAGGIGNDTYTVDNAADVVIEAVGEGNDTVNASVSYTLGTGSEVETLIASVTTGIALTGNELNNIVSSGAGADTISGGLGNDTLRGFGGNDTLFGDGGDDLLDGMAGADTMAGGAGNDNYWVDNSADVVTEAAGEGTDTVWASVSYTLGATSEVEFMRVNTTVGLTLTGNAFSHNIIGGAGNDTLIGGAGNDLLNGNAGADTMAGGAGNDTYFADNAGDVVTEAVAGGTDTVLASVNYALSAGQEIEFLRANSAAGLTLTGNAFTNTVVGGAGSDTLDGGAGNDFLTGGAGNDVFKFSAAGFGADTINDFAPGIVAGSQDLMDISGLGITAASFAANVKIAASAGGATTISFTGSTDSIRLVGVAAVNVTQADFITLP